MEKELMFDLGYLRLDTRIKMLDARYKTQVARLWILILTSLILGKRKL